MSPLPRLVTAEELARIPDDDHRYELVRGLVIRTSPPGSEHGFLAIRLGSLLYRHVEARGLGAVMTETGFTLASHPDTVRAPDLAFVRHERIPAGGLPRGFWIGAPDLAVEILSPDDRAAEVSEKVEEYLACGVRLVWVVNPDDQSVTVYRPGAAPVTLGPEGVLEGGEVVAGFTCRVRAIFP
jgi:Uma2 family endonuclease